MKIEDLSDFIERRLLQLLMLPVYYVLVIKIILNPPPAHIPCGNVYFGYYLGLLILSSITVITIIGSMAWKGGFKFTEYLTVLALICIPVVIGFNQFD